VRERERERAWRAWCPKQLSNGRRAYLVRYKAPDGRPRSKQFARRRDADLFASSVEVEIASVHCAGVEGWMFLLFRNTFSGSYLAFTSTSRR
jgi:hypothetical protein